MSNHIWCYRPPEPDDAVANYNGTGITALKTFHVLRHEKGKWHFLVPVIFLIVTVLQRRDGDQQSRCCFLTHFGRFGRSACSHFLYNRSLIHLALGEGIITDIKIAAICQLKVSHIARFRAVLSRKYSCPHLHAYTHVGLI
jgi:hypothetical protein